MISGVAMMAAGGYCLAFVDGAAVYGWILALFGGWVFISLHPWLRDRLLDVNTYVRGPADPVDALLDD